MSISNWDHKALMGVADTIRELLQDEAIPQEQKQRLLPILELARAGSHVLQPDSELLSLCRQQLCEVRCQKESGHCNGRSAWTFECRHKQAVDRLSEA